MPPKTARRFTWACDAVVFTGRAEERLRYGMHGDRPIPLLCVCPKKLRSTRPCMMRLS